MEAFANFDALLEQVQKNPAKRVMAVAGANDRHVLEAVLEARRRSIADFILLGDAPKIRTLLTELDASPSDFDIVATEPGRASAQAAVELVQEGSAHFLMKGYMDTKDMLGPVVSKDNRLRTGRVMSHFALNQLPNYKKLIVNTDGGMMLYPTLEEKRQILENAVITLRAMGYERPKVAVLAGVEKPNPKMQETLDAEALMKLNQSGEITGCDVEGPLSYDVALREDIAQLKNAPYRHCGDYDVLLLPNLAAGNILGKCWAITAGGAMAGIIVGARVPVVLSSRGATAEEKYLSVALAALAASETGATA